VQDSPVVPIGRSPRTDVLLKAEKIVLEFGGSVLRLSGLYISFLESCLPGFFLLPIYLCGYFYYVYVYCLLPTLT